MPQLVKLVLFVWNCFVENISYFFQGKGHISKSIIQLNIKRIQRHSDIKDNKDIKDIKHSETWDIFLRFNGNLQNFDFFQIIEALPCLCVTSVS